MSWFLTGLPAYFTAANVYLKFISYYFLSNKHIVGEFSTAYNSTDNNTFAELHLSHFLSFPFPSKTLFGLQISFTPPLRAAAVAYLWTIHTKSFSWTEAAKA